MSGAVGQVRNLPDAVWYAVRVADAYLVEGTYDIYLKAGAIFQEGIATLGRQRNWLSVRKAYGSVAVYGNDSARGIFKDLGRLCKEADLEGVDDQGRPLWIKASFINR